MRNKANFGGFSSQPVRMPNGEPTRCWSRNRFGGEIGHGGKARKMSGNGAGRSTENGDCETKPISGNAVRAESGWRACAGKAAKSMSRKGDSAK